MSTKVLIPYSALLTVNDVTASPAVHGTIVVTYEVRAALDADPANFTHLWSGDDQPVIWEYANLTLPTDAFDGGSTAIYVRIEAAAFEALGSDYNLYKLTTKATAGGSETTEGIKFHGDGTDSGSYILLDTTVEDAAGQPRHGQTVIYMDDGLSTERYIILRIQTENANIGADYDVYQLMNGILLTLPDYDPERTYGTDFYGGSNLRSPMGRQMWQGIKSGEKRTHTAIFQGLNDTQRELIVNVHKYMRGAFPFLFIEDAEDVDTWMLCTSQKLSEIEQTAGLYTLEWELQEC